MARRRFPDPRPGFRTHREPTVVGVASTGQVSKKGTVTYWSHWMGEQDATVRPTSLSVRYHISGGVWVPAELRYDKEKRTWLPLAQENVPSPTNSSRRRIEIERIRRLLTGGK